MEEYGFANGFSTRLGGVSPFPKNDLNLAGFDEDADENIFENRKRFLSLFNGRFSLTTVWQVHGSRVKTVKNINDALKTKGKYDAIISNLPEILTGVKTADCVPILIGDKKSKAFASIHAGWRGTSDSIAQKTIEKMKAQYGTNPSDLICAIGPSAGYENYEIGQEVIDAFTRKFSASEKLFKQTRPNHALIDLHLANKDQLMETGVLAQHIFTAPFCTMERTDLFFSYRIEKRKYGKTGHLMSVIGLK